MKSRPAAQLHHAAEHTSSSCSSSGSGLYGSTSLSAEIPTPCHREDARQQSVVSYLVAVLSLFLLCGMFYWLLGVGVYCLYQIFVNGSMMHVLFFVFLFSLSYYPNQCLWQSFIDCPVWVCMREYFSYTMYKEFDDLDRDRKYIFVEFPHGVMPLGFILSATMVQPQLSGLRIEGAIASVLFRIPLIRQLCFWMGARPATHRNMSNVLQQGHSLGLLAGGIAEIFLSSREEECIFLRKRRGFVRVALEQGADLVPVYYFGTTHLLSFVGGSGGGVLSRISRRLRTSLLFFYGRWYTPVPFQQPITMVVGRPIRVERVDQPTPLQVDALHARFVAETEALFDKYKVVAGWADRQLKIV